MGVGVDGVGRRRAAAAAGVVHDVVVEQGERVHQLERRADVDDALIVGVAAGADESPVTERRPQALAAGLHHAVISSNGPARSASSAAQRSPLGFDQGDQPVVDARRDRGQTRRRSMPAETIMRRGRRAAGPSRSAITSSMRMPGRADALAAEGDQLGRPGDPVGELVDVDVAGLQLARGSARARRARWRSRARWRRLVSDPSVMVIGLRVGCGTAPCCVRRPSANCVLMTSPADDCRGERRTVPSAPRVIVQPRPSIVTGSSVRALAARPSSGAARWRAVGAGAADSRDDAGGQATVGAKRVPGGAATQRRGAETPVLPRPGRPRRGCGGRCGGRRSPRRCSAPSIRSRAARRPPRRPARRGRGTRCAACDEGLGTRRRRLERAVGDLVGDAAVDLVAEAGEHRQPATGDRHGDRLGVEHRQFVARPAAADDDDGVERCGGPARSMPRQPSPRPGRLGPARRTRSARTRRRCCAARSRSRATPRCRRW